MTPLDTNYAMVEEVEGVKEQVRKATLGVTSFGEQVKRTSKETKPWHEQAPAVTPAILNSYAHKLP